LFCNDVGFNVQLNLFDYCSTTSPFLFVGFN